MPYPKAVTVTVIVTNVIREIIKFPVYATGRDFFCKR
jgi:hypothetical protein